MTTSRSTSKRTPIPPLQTQVARRPCVTKISDNRDPYECIQMLSDQLGPFQMRSDRTDGQVGGAVYTPVLNGKTRSSRPGTTSWPPAHVGGPWQACGDGRARKDGLRNEIRQPVRRGRYPGGSPQSMQQHLTSRALQARCPHLGGSGNASWDKKNAKIVILYKNKGDIGDCNLLPVTGKVFARLLLRRLQVLAERVLHDVQCGFRAGRFTTDMIFTLQQLQEKYARSRTSRRCICGQAIWQFFFFLRHTYLEELYKVLGSSWLPSKVSLSLTASREDTHTLMGNNRRHECV